MSLTNALKSLFKEPIKRRKKMPITFFFGTMPTTFPYTNLIFLIAYPMP